MLESVRDLGKLTERRGRLFAVACCRRIRHLLTDERSRTAVEVGERYADGAATAKEMGRAFSAAYPHSHTLSGRWHAAAYASTRTSVIFAKDAIVAAEFASLAVVPRRRRSEAYAGYQNEKAAQSALLRDIFGNPFRAAPTLEPSLLTWNNGLIAQLAKAAYEERSLPEGHLDQGRLAVLADALEEAGSVVTEILAHLRGPGPHVRGCHVLDAILRRS
jgi:hypothetical protein